MNIFSGRLPWLAQPNSYSRLLQQQRESGVPLLDLTTSNPCDAFDDYPDKEIGEAFGAVKDYRYYPNPLGTQKARSAIANWYEEQGISVSPERIVLTASSSEAYGHLFKLLCDPGDQVLIPAPSYPLFEHLALAESVSTQPYRLGYDGSWFLDFESLRKRATTRTRVVVVVNPNNPTGSFLKEREWAELSRFSQENSVPVICDEVFMNYAAQEQASGVQTLIGRDEALSFSLNGLSKAAGMPQMKLGWIVVNGGAEEARAALARLELLLDNYLSVGTPVQNALPALLRIGEMLRGRIAGRIKANRAALGRVFSGSAAHVLNCEGGWSGIVQFPRLMSEEAWVTRILLEVGVIVQPGYFYDMAEEAYVVVSLLTAEKRFSDGLERIRSLVSNS